MITIIFETHATTIDNENRIASGHYDAPLSALGERQARELGARRRRDQIDTVFCSDLQRSYRTAEIAFAGREIPIIKDPRLRECDYGDWTRKPSEVILSDGPNRITEPFPNGESYRQVMARMKSYLQDLLRDHDGKQILIIGHRGTHYGLELWITGQRLEKILTERWPWQPGWMYTLTKI